MAADMKAAPVYTKAPMMAPAYNWTGCYLGGEGGYASGRSRHTVTTGTTLGDAESTFTMSGGIAGGTLGCNYQTSNIVLGIEGDLSWTNKSGSAFEQAPFNTTRTNLTSEKWLDTARGRLGFTWDRALLYVTGGGAFANIGVQVCATVVPVCASDSANVWGWAIGAGVEWGLWDNWTLKAEYLHVDFGTTSFLSPPVIIGTQTFQSRNVPVTDDLFRVGLNYRLGWMGAVMSKY
jgi:outer membrane immunogenic protein